MPDRDPGTVDGGAGTAAPDAESLARGYYESIDAGDYEALASLLAADFCHVRGDRTIEGRDAFVRFMREGRPETDTTHAVAAVFPAPEGDRVAVRGRLLRADGSTWFGFVDVFAVGDGALLELTTYTNGRVE